MKEGHSKCAECTRRGRPCDGQGISLVAGEAIPGCPGVLLVLICGVADRLALEKQRLEAAEEATEEELIQLQQQLNERLSRLMRLRRQKRQLVEKGTQMLNRGLASMDELDETERLESEAVVSAQSVLVTDLIDWNAVGSSFDFSSGVIGEGSSEGVAHG